MLTNEQLKTIEEKENLTLEDVYLLEHHIFEIGKVQEEYGDNLPSDVMINLRNDLERIIVRLNKYLNKKGIYNFSKNIDIK